MQTTKIFNKTLIFQKEKNEIVNHFQLKCKQVFLENDLVSPRVFNFLMNSKINIILVPILFAFDRIF